MSDFNPTFTPLVITGEMRSGTTLLANFLNSQKECLVYADVLKSWFYEVGRLGLRDLGAPLSERGRNVASSSLAAAGWQSGISGWERIDRGSFSTPFDLFLQALAALDSAGDCKVIGVKMTQQFGLCEGMLDRGVKIIYCIRDPRDVLLSAKNRFGDYNMFQRCIEWRGSVRRAQDRSRHPNLHLIKFEDLVADETREEEIQKLSRFLGVPIDGSPGGLIHRDGVSFSANSSFGDVDSMFDQRVLRRWMDHLGSPEVTFATRFLEREIRQLGYEGAEVGSSYPALYRFYLGFRAKKWVREVLLSVYRRILVTSGHQD